jgi:hypothetical protein
MTARTEVKARPGRTRPLQLSLGRIVLGARHALIDLQFGFETRAAQPTVGPCPRPLRKRRREERRNSALV